MPSLCLVTSSTFQNNCSATPAFPCICSSFTQLCHDSPRPPKQTPNSLGRQIMILHGLVPAASGLPLRLSSPTPCSLLLLKHTQSLQESCSHFLPHLHTNWFLCLTCPSTSPASSSHHRLTPLGELAGRLGMESRLLLGPALEMGVPCGEWPTSKSHSGSMRQGVVME